VHHCVDILRLTELDVKIEYDIALNIVITTDNMHSTDNTAYYFFALPSKNNSSTVLYVRVNLPLIDIKGLQEAKKQSQKFIEFNIVKYYKGIDTPLY